MAAAVGVYLNAFGHEFFYDDAQIVRDNLRIRSLTNLPELFTTDYWGEFGDRGLYRPLVLLTYALNYAVGGLSTWGYTAVNIAVHAGVSVLVASLTRSLGASASVATGAGLLFAVHPVHTEAVGMIVGRADSLGALFFLLALLLHRRPAASQRPARARRVGVTACFVAALLCKENTATFLPVVLAMDWLLPDCGKNAEVDSRPSRLGDYLWYVVALVAVLGVRWLVLGTWTVPLETLSPIDNPLVPLQESPLGNVYGATWFEARFTALSVLVDYLRLLAWPLQLSADYSLNQLPVARSAWAPAVLAGAALVGATVAGVVLLRRRAPIAAFGLAFGGLTLAITSNLLFPIGTICGERLLYLPSAGFLIAATSLGSLLGRRVGLALLLATTALCVVRTWQRNPDLRDPRSFWEATAAASSRSTKANWGLGGELGQRAVELDRQRRHSEATELYVRALHHLGLALEIYPESAYALNEIANIYLVQGRFAEALQLYERAASFNPELPVTWANWGLALKVLAQQGDASLAPQAIEKLTRAIELWPNHAANYTLRAEVYQTLLGDTARASADLETARRLQRP